MLTANSNGRIDLDFPLRVAAIDIGSNGIRFIAAEFLDPSRWIELRYQRMPVRLGRSAFTSGRLTADAIEAGVRALVTFRRHLDTLGIENYRAVATSAVRESENGRELVTRGWSEAGIRVETITGGEEARLVWRAVNERFPLDGRWMLVDLGGGSVEISVVHGDGIEWSESHTMGAVRLLERLGGSEPGSEERLGRLIDEYLGALRLPTNGSSSRDGGLEGMIATGGNIETLASLVGADADVKGISRVPLIALRAQNDRLARLTYRERVEKVALREDRADVIIPAGRAYQRIAELAGADEIVVPHVGLKDGLLLDLVEDLTTHSLHADRQSREVWDAAVALGRRYRFDEAHGIQVARLSLSLFDQLERLHRLGARDRQILHGASLLHDIGQFVSYRKHHKHSFYLILNGELSVFSIAELPLVALVARYHRGSEPRADHELWSELDREDRSRVLRLAAMLRVADALDREHLQRVSEVRTRISEDELLLDVEGEGDLLLEAWAVDKKSGLFEMAYGLKPRLLDPGEAKRREAVARQPTTRGAKK